MHSAGLLGQRQLFAVPDFSRNLAVLFPGNGNEKVQESRAPGKQEPGNGNTSLGSQDHVTSTILVLHRLPVEQTVSDDGSCYDLSHYQRHSNTSCQLTYTTQDQ